MSEGPIAILKRVFVRRPTSRGRAYRVLELGVGVGVTLGVVEIMLLSKVGLVIMLACTLCEGSRMLDSEAKWLR